MKELMTVFVVLLLAAAAHAGEWHIEMVDSEGNVGWYTSLALDASGNPHISYCSMIELQHWIPDDLKYARWDGNEWRIETVHSDYYSGDYTSLALDSSGHPHISFRDVTWTTLKYAYWAGSSWYIETVDSEGNVGMYTSLALDSSGWPHISYYDEINGDLKYARWDGSEWHIETVDSEGNVGVYTSLALDSSDRPYISYMTWWGVYNLKYARWTGSAWQIETVDSEGSVGWFSSLALDSSNRPRIAYYDNDIYDLKYARWDGADWQIEIVDSEGDMGMYCSLALDALERPNISYYDYDDENLKYARWDGSSWQITTIDSNQSVGMFTSLALGFNDNPHISYYDYTNGSLKYAHWEGGPGVEEVELSAVSTGEGVLVGWTITGDTPAALRVLRSAGDEGPTSVSGDLDGAAARWLDRGAYDASDKGLKPLAYWLEVVEADGFVKRFGPTEAVRVPEKGYGLALDAAHPSPARDFVNITYTLPADGRVALLVYDLSGRRVATLVDADQTAGRHEVFWSCVGVHSGVYLYRLETGAGSLTRRLVVSR